MTQHVNTPGSGPTPEQLTAFVDGELEPAQRHALEAWLADHPEARAEVEGQRRLAQFWRGVVLEEPGEGAWARLLAQIEADLGAHTGAAPVGKPPRRMLAGRLWAAGGLVAGAAAVLLVLFLSGRSGLPAPLSVASDDDVEIISMDGGDADALVVGSPPVQGPLDLASARDVQVDDTGHDVEVIAPDPEQPGRDSVPMLMVPLEPDKEP